MKSILSILIISVLLVGCRSTKKLTESSAVISNQTETVQKADVKEETKVNNDKTTYKKTVITKTVYDTQIKPSEPSEPSSATSVTIEPSKPESVVLSTEVTTIEEITGDKSEIETKKSDNSEVATKTKEDSKVETKNAEKKSVPIPWGWIFAVLALITGVVLYFTKPKFLTVFFTFIKKLFA